MWSAREWCNVVSSCLCVCAVTPNYGFANILYMPNSLRTVALTLGLRILARLALRAGPEHTQGDVRSVRSSSSHDDEGFVINVIPVGSSLGSPVGGGTLALLSSRVMAASAVLAAAMFVEATRLTSSPAPSALNSAWVD